MPVNKSVTRECKFLAHGRTWCPETMRWLFCQVTITAPSRFQASMKLGSTIMQEAKRLGHTQWHASHVTHFPSMRLEA